tara:strand:- start:41 stop:1522 length:1482 start_codon:yes stop_codon:yes gene_type:complete
MGIFDFFKKKPKGPILKETTINTSNIDKEWNLNLGGELHHKFYVLNGVIDGVHKEFDTNGNLRIKRVFKKGELKSIDITINKENLDIRNISFEKHYYFYTKHNKGEYLDKGFHFFEHIIVNKETKEFLFSSDKFSDCLKWFDNLKEELLNTETKKTLKDIEKYHNIQKEKMFSKSEISLLIKIEKKKKNRVFKSRHLFKGKNLRFESLEILPNPDDPHYVLFNPMTKHHNNPPLLFRQRFGNYVPHLPYERYRHPDRIVFYSESKEALDDCLKWITKGHTYEYGNKSFTNSDEYGEKSFLDSDEYVDEKTKTESITPIPKNCGSDLEGPNNIPFVKAAIKEYDKLLEKNSDDSDVLFKRGYAKRYLTEHWKPNINSTKKYLEHIKSSGKAETLGITKSKLDDVNFFFQNSIDLLNKYSKEYKADWMMASNLGNSLAKVYLKKLNYYSISDLGEKEKKSSKKEKFSIENITNESLELKIKNQFKKQFGEDLNID